MHDETGAPASSASVFNLRENWNHLAIRPASQEPVIDGVRAIAILWVVVLHMVFFHFSIFPTQAIYIFYNPFTSWIQNGILGVDLFFVISGFLMGSMLFGEMKKSGGLVFSRFYVRRFLRLIPVYTAAMAIALYFQHGDPGLPKWGNAQNFWANLLYVNNFLPVMKQYMGWCWSLALEEQFYLLLPACILLFMGLGKGRIRILVGLMILSGTIRYAVIHFSGIVPPFRFAPYTPAWNAWFDVVYDKPWMRFGGLLSGVTGAYLNCYFMPQLKRFFARTRLITTLSIGCLLLYMHIASTAMGSFFFDMIPYVAREIWWALHRDIFSLAVMFLILAAIHTPKLFGGRLRRFLSWRGFYPVAQLSYSIYLVHEMLFDWLFIRIAPIFSARLGAYGTMALDSAIGLVATFVIASTLYVMIERPCMRLRSHPAVLSLIDCFRRPKLVLAASEEA
jgi:peptidoglycan/LPS O-acetylase OafA/YrhL